MKIPTSLRSLWYVYKIFTPHVLHLISGIIRLVSSIDWTPSTLKRNQVLPSLLFSPLRATQEIIQKERRSTLDLSLPVSHLGRIRPTFAHIIPPDVVVFHAGTARSNDKVVTSGGRVLAVSAHAETLQAALDAAYSAVENIRFYGKTYRRDIAHRLFWYRPMWLLASHISHIGLFDPQPWKARV